MLECKQTFLIINTHINEMHHFLFLPLPYSHLRNGWHEALKQTFKREGNTFDPLNMGGYYTLANPFLNIYSNEF